MFSENHNLQIYSGLMLSVHKNILASDTKSARSFE